MIVVGILVIIIGILVMPPDPTGMGAIGTALIAGGSCLFGQWWWEKRSK